MIKTETPDNFFARTYQSIKPSIKTAFLSACIVGFLTHAYVMTHQFVNYDAMWNLYSDQNMIASGRQFLMFACGLSSFYSLPWLIGLLSIFFLAMVSVAVTGSFGIESKSAVVITSALIVTFPSVASTFCYMFTADGYMMAIAFAAFAFFLCVKYKNGWIGGLFLLGISIGIYQAYLSFTIVMGICYFLLCLIEVDSLKNIAGKAWRFTVMLIGGYAFYVISLKIMLFVEGVSMSGYQGTDKVTSFSLTGIPAGLWSAVKNTGSFVIRTNVLRTNRFFTVVLFMVVLLSVVMYVILFIHKKRYESIVRIAATLVLVALLPFGLSTIAIMSPDVYFHLLMRMPWAVLLVFPLALTGRFHGLKKTGFEKTVKVMAALSIAALAFSYAVASNIAYFNMNERYEKTYAFCLRLGERLEQTQGYEHGMEVAILGGLPSQQEYPPTEVTTQPLKGYFGASGEMAVDSTQKIAAFMSHYQNITLQTVSSQREQELAAAEEYARMECFPSGNSIQKIDGVWVVKLQ